MEGGRGPRDGRLDAASPGDVAWIMLLPFVALAAATIVVVAPLLGDIAVPRPDLHYWDPPAAVRKAATQAGYLLMLGFVAAYATATVVVARRGLWMDARRRRALVLALQALAVVLVVVCWIAQRRIDVQGTRRVYFTLATIVAAVALAVLLVAVARGWRGATIARLRARLPDAGSPSLRAACLVLALLVVVTWLLPAVYSDAGIAVIDGAGFLAPPPELFGNAYYFDEATAVLNGLSPLVDMPAYGTLWPYAIALPFGALGGTYAAFTALMALVTGLSLLGVYAVLRRLAGDLPALGLFTAFVATSFFIERGSAAWRYDPGNYFGVFPLRYAGPYLLLWLTVRRIEQARAGRLGGVALFTAAGLVALNNLDFGLSAFAATAVAVAIGRRPRPGRLALEAGAGAALALLLVSALTLLRAGELPDLTLLGYYGRVFVAGGYGNVALPALGWHVVLTVTFVGALATAAARFAGDDRDRLLTATLAWVGIFGLGASTYYYAYRSHPDVLLNLFSIWALTLALLALVVLRSERTRRGAPALPGLLVLFGLGLAACSVAQLPPPWTQLARVAEAGGIARPLELSEMSALVRERTRPGERILILAPVGHRVARAAGVVDVGPYPGLGQMPAREQLGDTLALLRRRGGGTVFVAQPPPPGMLAYMRRRGYERVAVVEGIGWSGSDVIELRRGGG